MAHSGAVVAGVVGVAAVFVAIFFYGGLSSSPSSGDYSKAPPQPEMVSWKDKLAEEVSRREGRLWIRCGSCEREKGGGRKETECVLSGRKGQ
jgi:hypothetical protein